MIMLRDPLQLVLLAASEVALDETPDIDICFVQTLPDNEDFIILPPENDCPIVILLPVTQTMSQLIDDLIRALAIVFSNDTKGSKFIFWRDKIREEYLSVKNFIQPSN